MAECSGGRFHSMDFWFIHRYVAISLATFFLTSLGQCSNVMERSEMCFKELPIIILQRHIMASRHSPICLIYRHHDTGSKLERKFCQFWNQRSKYVMAGQYNYSLWQAGAFAADKVVIQGALELPQQLPTLRCHLGLASPSDFKGKISKKRFAKWFSKLGVKYSDQLKEATVDVLERTINENKLTLIGFSSDANHHSMEQAMYEIREESSQLAVLFVHRHSPHIRLLANIFNVTTYPSALFIERSTDSKYGSIVKKLVYSSVTKRAIMLYLQSRNTPAARLTMENFAQTVLEDEEYNNIPMLVCFYNSHFNQSRAYLYAFERSIREAMDLDLKLRFGMVDLDDEKYVLHLHVEPSEILLIPFTVLYNPMLDGKSVISIKQKAFVERPTPATLFMFLKHQDVKLVNKRKKKVRYTFHKNQGVHLKSHSREGPYGTECAVSSHNATESDPIVFRIKKKKRSKINVVKQKRNRHDLFDTDSMEKRLQKKDGIPVVSMATWADVVEKSHAPGHPFVAGQQWRGEVSKVTLVIFIIQECDYCRKSIKTFQEIKHAVNFIEGGATYYVDCTADQEICEENEVTGFPTLSVFRGIGWLASSQCLSVEASKKTRYVRMDYHGLMLVKDVMEWFSSVSGGAVKNLGHKMIDPTSAEENVYLVGTLVPKDSNYIPLDMRRKSNFLFPYECYRLVCERLFGPIGCYVQYSKDGPVREFGNEKQDMIVTRVKLFRRDGLDSTVTELGKLLKYTLENDGQIHTFHHVHRYNIGKNQHCEDDHGRCTDLIVDYTRDHGRLLITEINTATFHAKSSSLLTNEFPVLIAMVHKNNISESSLFHKMMLSVARETYSKIQMTSLDVDEYINWANLFVPKNYNIRALGEESPTLYHYPRFVLVSWSDHRHAAFYPSINVQRLRNKDYKFTRKRLLTFMNKFLKDRDKMMIETEHY